MKLAATRNAHFKAIHYFPNKWNTTRPSVLGIACLQNTLCVQINTRRWLIGDRKQRCVTRDPTRFHLRAVPNGHAVPIRPDERNATKWPERLYFIRVPGDDLLGFKRERWKDTENRSRNTVNICNLNSPWEKGIRYFYDSVSRYWPRVAVEPARARSRTYVSVGFQKWVLGKFVYHLDDSGEALFYLAKRRNGPRYRAAGALDKFLPHACETRASCRDSSLLFFRCTVTLIIIRTSSRLREILGLRNKTVSVIRLHRKLRCSGSL